MQLATIQKTYPADFDRVYPLLQAFDSPHTRDNWRRIFTYCWDKAHEHVGFHLEDSEGKIVGFMGLIFSQRIINESMYDFCNITSWIIKPEYRASTILFLRELIALKDVVLTGFSPIEASYRVLREIGFQVLESSYRIIPVVNAWRVTKKKGIAHCEMPAILGKIDEELRRVVENHVKTNTKVFLFSSHDDQCILTVKVIRQKYKSVFVNKLCVLSISDLAFFHANISQILYVFRKLYGLLTALYVDSRFFPSNFRGLFIRKDLYPPRIMRGSIASQLVDQLYSEEVLL